MILLIGTQNCPRCKMTKTILDDKNIQYTYKLNTEMSKNELDKYINMAKTKGLMNFPLIIKDEEIITLDNVAE